MQDPAALCQRIDLLLVERGLFESRAKAQKAIAAGLVMADGRPVAKSSEKVPQDAVVAAEAPYPWVSRGGVKLAAALDRFGFDPRSRVCLDLGASTGGFSHVLLARGAAVVHAVDVGHGQLHPSLAADPRLRLRERCDARDLVAEDFAIAPTVLTCDLSFISLGIVLPRVLPLIADGGWLVALVKPQFEAGRAFVGKGVVRDAEARERAVAKVAATIADAGWLVAGTMVSPIVGGDGNVEYLLGATR